MTDQPSILLMDDDVVFRTDLAKYLSEQGYQVTSCDSATEAKAHIEDRPYDLVISDIFVRANGEFIPDGGVSLLGWMQTRHKIPKIAVSGAIDRIGHGYLHDMRELGADVCLMKPIDEDELLRHIRVLLPKPDLNSGK